MKKIKYLLITLLFALVIGINRVDAFSINATSSVYVNQTVAVTVEANGLIGRFDITSSNGNVLAGGDSKWIEDGSVTLYFTAKSVGSATITVTAVDVADGAGNSFTGSRSISINVINKTNSSNPSAGNNGNSNKPTIDINKVYNTNNYLSSLNIEGYDLNPVFNKDTLEYKLTLEPGTESIKVNATLEDDKANVRGTGEVAVSDGINTIEVIAIAENGNERVYRIIATLEEKDPIKVIIGKKNYTVVKKQELLGTHENYQATTIKIDGIEVPALYNEVTKVTLVALKDDQGNISLFAYDTKTGNYSAYLEFTFDLMNLFIHEDSNSKYKKIKLKINDKEVSAYKLDGIDDYYLIYATNIATGYEGYYLYDKIENSVQRYDTALLDKITNEKDKYLSIVLVLSSVCFLTMLFLLIMVNRDNKLKNEV